jgi:thioredoxin 1
MRIALSLLAAAALAGGAGLTLYSSPSNAKDMMKKDAMMKNSVKAFTPAALMAAQKAGKPIIVSAHAGWCPVCRAQAPILDKLTAMSDNADIVVLRADYDKQRADLKKLGVTGQSTLIGYRGTKEVSRTMGDTDEMKIAAVFAKVRG